MSRSTPTLPSLQTAAQASTAAFRRWARRLPRARSALPTGETVFSVLAHRLTDPGGSRRGLDCRDLTEQPITEGWSVCNWVRPFTKAESGQKSRVVLLRHQTWLIQQWNLREAGWKPSLTFSC